MKVQMTFEPFLATFAPAFDPFSALLEPFLVVLGLFRPDKRGNAAKNGKNQNFSREKKTKKISNKKNRFLTHKSENPFETPNSKAYRICRFDLEYGVVQKHIQPNFHGPDMCSSRNMWGRKVALQPFQSPAKLFTNGAKIDFNGNLDRGVSYLHLSLSI